MPEANLAGIINSQQAANNTSASVSGTSATILQSRLGRSLRVGLVITPLTAGVTVNVALSELPATTTTGFQLQPGQVLSQSANNALEAAQVVWQGSVQAIASGAGTVAIVEQFLNMG